MLKYLSLLSTFTTAASHQPGHCPPPASSSLSPSSMGHGARAKLLTGPWITVIEENASADEVTCPGTRFDPIKKDRIRLS